MKKLLIFNLSFLLFTFYFLLSTSEVRAQSLSLSIWPPLLEVMIQPGKSMTQVYKIANPSESDVVLTSVIASFAPADEEGNIELITNNSQLEDWFSFQNADLALGQDFVLKAGKEQEVVLRIAVPAGAAEDDYYYSLLFETLAPNEAFGGVGNQAQIKIGANILLTISRTGEPPRKTEIAEFTIGKLTIIDSFDQPQFLLRLRNTGQAFFKPMGAITISGWFGQKFTLDLLPENVLANSVRQVGCQKDSNPMSCVVSSKFLLGRYTARAELGLDEADGEYQKEIIFWAIPAKLILGILTTILLLYIVKTKIKTSES